MRPYVGYIAFPCAITCLLAFFLIFTADVTLSHYLDWIQLRTSDVEYAGFSIWSADV